MEHMVNYVDFMALLCAGAVIYLLYCQGVAISKSITAIIFVFHPGRNADKAALSSCSGWVRHVGRFYESRSYEFVLHVELSKGNVEVVLLDREKRQLMKLNQQYSISKINLDAESRYYLRWEFKGATGKCELRW